MGLAALAVQVVVRPREALGGVSRDIRVWRFGERFWKHFFGPISRLISLNHPVLGVVVLCHQIIVDGRLYATTGVIRGMGERVRRSKNDYSFY